MTLYIKNMACESCKEFVKKAIENLKLHPIKVDLGEVVIKEDIKPAQKEKLNTMIKKVGLEIVEDNAGIIIQKIKAHMHAYLNSSQINKVNFSDYLSNELKLDYTYLSNTFSELEATTISHYMSRIKMERAKEMILFEDLTMSEIAEKLYYSNSSHFSTQFKKVTGFPPSHFRNLKEKRRYTIQEINKRSSTSKKTDS